MHQRLSLGCRGLFLFDIESNPNEGLCWQNAGPSSVCHCKSTKKHWQGPGGSHTPGIGRVTEALWTRSRAGGGRARTGQGGDGCRVGGSDL